MSLFTLRFLELYFEFVILQVYAYHILVLVVVVVARRFVLVFAFVHCDPGTSFGPISLCPFT